MDAGRIERHPANAAIRRFLGEGRRARPAEPYAIDGWELGAHPDLEERLASLAEGLAGASSAGLRGVPVVVDGEGIVRAAATGMSVILLRLPPGPVRDDVLAHRGAEVPDLGPGWVQADAWQGDAPRAAGTARLRTWVAAALVSSPD